jgi:hypothetical protein
VQEVALVLPLGCWLMMVDEFDEFDAVRCFRRFLAIRNFESTIPVTLNHRNTINHVHT